MQKTHNDAMSGLCKAQAKLPQAVVGPRTEGLRLLKVTARSEQTWENMNGMTLNLASLSLTKKPSKTRASNGQQGSSQLESPSRSANA